MSTGGKYVTRGGEEARTCNRLEPPPGIDKVEAQNAPAQVCTSTTAAEERGVARMPEFVGMVYLFTHSSVTTVRFSQHTNFGKHQICLPYQFAYFSANCPFAVLTLL